MNVFISYYDSPIGKMKIVQEDDAITKLSFSDGRLFSSDDCTFDTPLIQKLTLELTQYFAHKRTTFDIPLSPNGTLFQKKVWQALLTIPYGQTRSYKQIAESIGCPKGSRAIGLANHNNPIAILIPCHRVIGTNGKLVGYAGGLTIKQYLLTLENTPF